MSKLPTQNVVNLRTFDPKYTHYYSDGTGRDTFVGYNNGGFCVPRLFNPQQGTAFMRMGSPRLGGQPQKQVSASPRIEPMPVEYRSDGTGRDSYIVCNSGGL